MSEQMETQITLTRQIQLSAADRLKISGPERRARYASTSSPRTGCSSYLHGTILLKPPNLFYRHNGTCIFFAGQGAYCSVHEAPEISSCLKGFESLKSPNLLSTPSE
jgi:hypothetical protein